MAGLSGWTWGTCCGIAMVWVRESSRAHGAGARCWRRRTRGPRARLPSDRRLVVHLPGPRLLRAARLRPDGPDREPARRGGRRRPPGQAPALTWRPPTQLRGAWRRRLLDPRPSARSDLTDTRLEATPLPDRGPGEALLRVDRVGLTANNVTYAVLGDAFRYWEFFPPSRAGASSRCGASRRSSESRVDGLEPAGASTATCRPAATCWSGPAGSTSRGFRDASRAPGDAALAVQRLRADDRRSGVRTRPGGPAGAVPAAVLDVVHARRLARRQRRHGRRADRAVLGVEQDRLRRRVRAAAAGPRRSSASRRRATSRSPRASAATTRC